jgi:hypothetical protein
MTTERHAWASLHPLEAARQTRPETCTCGQDLDCCASRNCPRCGTSLAPRVCA